MCVRVRACVHNGPCVSLLFYMLSILLFWTIISHLDFCQVKLISVLVSDLDDDVEMCVRGLIWLWISFWYIFWHLDAFNFVNSVKLAVLTVPCYVSVWTPLTTGLCVLQLSGMNEGHNTYSCFISGFCELLKKLFINFIRYLQYFIFFIPWFECIFWRLTCEMPLVIIYNNKYFNNVNKMMLQCNACLDP